MKKVQITIAFVIAATVLMLTSCKSSERCPAYGKSPKADLIKHA